MKRVLSSLVVCVGLAAAALAFAGVASAKHAVPFKAGCSGTASASGGHASSVASCQATHLGDSTETISVALTPGPGPFCQTNLGTGVLTAANGDQIFVAASGTSCFDPATGLVDLSGTQTITGGSGRFEGASGTLTVTGTVNPATNAISYTLDGSISY
jgi:hypothetical protein